MTVNYARGKLSDHLRVSPKLSSAMQHSEITISITGERGRRADRWMDPKEEGRKLTKEPTNHLNTVSLKELQSEAHDPIS